MAKVITVFCRSLRNHGFFFGFFQRDVAIEATTAGRQVRNL